MSVFDQNICEAVRNAAVCNDSSFYKKWVSKHIQVEGWNSHNLNFTIKNDLLQTDCMGIIADFTSSNMPCEYIPGLKGIDWPFAEITINCGGKDFVGREFKELNGWRIHIRNTKKIKNWDFSANQNCFFYFNTPSSITNCTFKSNIVINCNQLPDITNCKTDKQISIQYNIKDKKYIPDFLANLYSGALLNCEDLYTRYIWGESGDWADSDIKDIQNFVSSLRLNVDKINFALKGISEETHSVLMVTIQVKNDGKINVQYFWI